MKIKFLSFAIMISALITLQSFSSQEKKYINIKKSQVNWEGKKIIGSSHKGTVNLLSGDVIIENNKLIGGHFVIDMTSINCLDLKGSKKEKIEKHLKATSFFNVKEYPEASFKINKVKKTVENNIFLITGDLTIKNVTKPQSFLLTLKKQSISGIITIKRDLYTIKYGTGLFGSIGNNAISNEFTLHINLLF